MVEGEIINDDGNCDITFIDVKFRSIVNIESALENFDLMRGLTNSSFIVNSDPEYELLPRFDEAPWRDRDSFGVGGTELGLDDSSVGNNRGSLVDFKLFMLWKW